MSRENSGSEGSDIGEVSIVENRIRDESVWSSADSYVGSRTHSTADRLQFNIYPIIKPDIDRKAYKTQKNCSNCEKMIAKRGITHPKKFNCKFCFNAVCNDCSPLTINHPESLKRERVCMNCFY